MNDILQRVEQIFSANSLIGNNDITEDEYSLMLDSVGTLCDNFEKTSYKLIFATLVEIAKRWKQSDTPENNEENSGYWDYVFKTLYGSDIDQQLCQKYRNVISWLGINSNIPVVKGGHFYYATVMMHAFAPKNSIYSFFDLCYNIFKKDLDFGFTSDDEWICFKVATDIVNVLGHGYSEDKKVSIGSSAYSIKIGLRSFALNEDLSADFVKFIKDTFYQINILFNRKKIPEQTRIEQYIVRWWKTKTETEKLSDETAQKRRFSTVSKQNIVAKYIRNDNVVFLCIPSIRLEDISCKIWLTVYLNGKQARSEEMRTKRGELVVATKPMEFILNDLLKEYDSINLRIEIIENGVVIFDSDKGKTISLNREFILFDGEIEVFSEINKPTNYFVYSKDIDALRYKPEELTTYGNYLYNIYPKPGDRLAGETKQVFFVDKEKAARLGKSACLAGNLADVKWILDDISCVVYGNSVKLMVPENLNLKALELRIDMKPFKLHNLKYEILENNCYQFGLIALGLISENEPIEISLYSYEKVVTLFTEYIIVLPNLDIHFNKSIYYGSDERKIILTNDNECNELTWNNQENEIRYPLKDGVLMIKIPYFRWRINEKEWYNEPINRKLWYKDFLENGDLLEIDNFNLYEEIKLFGKADGKPFEIAKNQTGKFEIGRGIYTNEGNKEIVVYCTNFKDGFELFKVSTKKHFIDNPLIYRNGKVLWDVENTFVGDKNNEFFLIMKGEYNNTIRTKIGKENKELTNIGEDIYKIKVKIKDKNIFLKGERYLQQAIFEGELIVGKPIITNEEYKKVLQPILKSEMIVGKSIIQNRESRRILHTIFKGELNARKPKSFKFKDKKILLKGGFCYQSDKSQNQWVNFIPKYFVDNIKIVHEGENDYFLGRLCVVDRFDNIIVLNSMKNENNKYVKINPVRIELRDSNTLWLVAGWQGGSDFIGELFCDLRRKGICNIAKEDKLYSEINLYKFEEIENV